MRRRARVQHGRTVAPRPTRGAMRGAPLGLVAVALSVTLSACGVPIPGDATQSGPVAPEGPKVDPLLPTDEGTERLAVELRALAAEVAIVRALLDEATVLVTSVPSGPRADALAQARELGRIAAARMLGEPVPKDGDDTDDEMPLPPGLLPAIAPDRAALGSTDLMTALVTLAGDTGGERSRVVVELVRDPMIGDLGAWQRDPLGVIGLVRASVEGERDPTQLDAALLELPGELPRALGYALALADASDVTMAEHAATRGAGRLGVVLIAIELTLESLGATTDVGTGATR